MVNRTADEENNPHQVTKGINGSNAYVEFFMSALAINGRINGEESHKRNKDVLQEVHAMFLAGHRGGISELYVGRSERKQELKEVKNTPIEWHHPSFRRQEQLWINVLVITPKSLLFNRDTHSVDTPTEVKNEEIEWQSKDLL